MGTVLIRNDIYDRPEFIGLRPDAFWLWITCLCWSSRQRTQGFVPRDTARRHEGKRRGAIRQLTDAGLWEPVEGGYQIANPTRRPLFQFRAPRYRPPIPDEVRQRVYARDGHACRHCGTTENLSLDHITPFSKGGSDHESNLQTLCRPCNSRKGVR